MKNFRLLILAALIPLAGCGGSAHKPASTAKAAATESGPTPFYCPQVAVLQQAQTLTLFLPNRQDVAARVSTAQITGVSGVCKLEKKKNALLVTVNISFVADNGPANNGAPLSLPWFTAITAGNNIVQKVNYTQTLKFAGNSTTAGAMAKPVKIELPNVPDTANTEILVGFQETQDQLAYAAAHPAAAP